MIFGVSCCIGSILTIYDGFHTYTLSSVYNSPRLMSFQRHVDNLEKISTAGYSVSLVMLVLAIVFLLRCRSVSLCIVSLVQSFKIP